MTRTNHQEHVRGIYKTGLGENLMRNFAWRDLPNVDRTVTHFASRVNFFYEDMDAMMVRSRQLQDELAAGAAWNQKPSGLPGLGTEGSWADLGFEDGKLDDALVARIVACEWVQNNTMKWSTWIPALCEPGTIPNPEMTSCLGCSAGNFCPDYRLDEVLCPEGHFCPVNSSEPRQCDRGRTSERGSASESYCQCSASSVWISNMCRPVVEFVLPVIVLPICVALILLRVGLLLVTARREDQKYIIDRDELDFGSSPQRFINHLGSGPAGRSVVYMATYRERKVAVKVMATPLGKDSPPLHPLGVRDRIDLDEPVACPPGLEREVSSALSTGRVSKESGPKVFSRRKAENVASVRLRNRQFLQEFRRTVQNWCRLPHTHLTVCHGICLQEDKVMIVMELMAYGSLCDILRNSTISMSEEMAIGFLTDITKGMMCLHSSKPQPTLHRCLSSTNVLLDGNLNAKLSDVGCPRLDAGYMAHVQAAIRERERMAAAGRTSKNSQKSKSALVAFLQYSANTVLSH